uniref:ASCH domain-containing protein n=1 Tax=Roseivirga sp. TaxID=1964215 RepID=UPI00404765C3
MSEAKHIELDPWRTLNLTIKKEWFDMILSGKKKEEYREIKPYWNSRLKPGDDFEQYNLVRFQNGYSKDAPVMFVICKGIGIGQAKPEWSNDWQGDVYVISLGEIITRPVVIDC